MSVVGRCWALFGVAERCSALLSVAEHCWALLNFAVRCWALHSYAERCWVFHCIQQRSGTHSNAKQRSVTPNNAQQRRTTFSNAQQRWTTLRNMTVEKCWRARKIRARKLSCPDNTHNVNSKQKITMYTKFTYPPQYIHREAHKRIYMADRRTFIHFEAKIKTYLPPFLLILWHTNEILS